MGDLDELLSTRSIATLCLQPAQLFKYQDGVNSPIIVLLVQSINAYQ